MLPKYEMKTFSIIIISSLLLMGCSTKYQPCDNSFWGDGCGYKDKRLSKTSYLVEYNSNEVTDQSTNLQHALRRAAELTKGAGYKYFKIENIINTSTSLTMPVTTAITPNACGYPTSITSGGYGCTEPGVALIITLQNIKTDGSHDAEELLKNLI